LGQAFLVGACVFFLNPPLDVIQLLLGLATREAETLQADEVDDKRLGRSRSTNFRWTISRKVMQTDFDELANGNRGFGPTIVHHYNSRRQSSWQGIGLSCSDNSNMVNEQRV
jgi:hypothetical protein